MADHSPLTLKDALVSPKTSPLLPRLLILVVAVMCGILICFVCVNKFDTASTAASFLNVKVQLSDHTPCPELDLHPSELPYVHYPKPLTYDRAECACNPVRLFAIVSTQRSGSGWFETLLNSHVNVSSNGEVFSVKPRRANVSAIVTTLDQLYNLDWVSSSSKNECTAAAGFKWMLNQGLVQNHEEVVKYFNSKGVSMIFLFRRNLLRRMISMLANTYDRDFKLLNGTHKSHVHSPREAEILASYKPVINATTLVAELKQVQKATLKALAYFNSTRHIMLYYEDVVKNRSKLLDVQDFLRVPRMNLTSRQVKIHKGSLSEHVANWNDIQRALNGTEYESFLKS